MRRIALSLLSFSKEFGLRHVKTESAKVLLLMMLIYIMSLFRPEHFRCQWLSSPGLLKATLETLALLKLWVFFFFFFFSSPELFDVGVPRVTVMAIASISCDRTVDCPGVKSDDSRFPIALVFAAEV